MVWTSQVFGNLILLAICYIHVNNPCTATDFKVVETLSNSQFTGSLYKLYNTVRCYFFLCFFFSSFRLHISALRESIVSWIFPLLILL